MVFSGSGGTIELPEIGTNSDFELHLGAVDDI